MVVNNLRELPEYCVHQGRQCSLGGGQHTLGRVQLDTILPWVSDILNQLYVAQTPNHKWRSRILHWSRNTERHFVCRENLGDEYKEGDAPYGVLDLCNLEDHIANDHGEINLWPLEDVFYEVSCLEGEVVAVSRWDEVLGEYLPKNFHSGLAILVGKLGAPTDVLCA